MRRSLAALVTVLIVGAALPLAYWPVFYLGSKLDRLATALERLETRGDSLDVTMRGESAKISKSTEGLTDKVEVVGAALSYWTQQAGKDK